MKILLIHCLYTQKGGEDAVFDQESELLMRKNTVEVIKLYNRNGILGGLDFACSLWNIPVNWEVREKINQFEPDIVHIHNWHFAFGPLIIRGIHKLGIPVLLTLHNYRLLCPSGTLFYNEKIFLESLNQKFPWKAIKLGVYRNSIVQTFWLAFIVYFHKKIGTWNMVDRFITLTGFAQNLFIEHLPEISASKFVEKANFVKDCGFTLNTSPKFLFIGRLSEEKGIGVILKVFSSSTLTLQIVGAGPEQQEVEKYASANANINYLGSLKKELVLKEMKDCTALIFPSIWYEGMPMTIIEALSSGTPVIASDLGSMKTMITHGYNGLLFNPNDPKDLAAKIDYWNDLTAEQKTVFRKNARLTYETLYLPSRNCEILEAQYTDLSLANTTKLAALD